MEFTFEASPVEQLLKEAGASGRISALDCLACIEHVSEEEAEEFLSDLAGYDVIVDVSELPGYEPDEKTLQRLKLEEKLAKDGQLMTGLEENDPLRLFLEEVAQMPADKNEKLLVAQYVPGDEEMGRQLAMLSLGRVVEQACKMTGRGVLLLDLIQEGCLGLWKGLMKYTGGDYETYINGWIERSLTHTVLMQARNNGGLDKMRQRMEDYRDTDQRLLSELGRNPTVEEIAEAMHITVEEAYTIAQMLGQANARQQVERSRAPREESPEDRQAVEDTAYFQIRQRIAEMLSTLTEQEAKLLSMRFGLDGDLPRTPQQVGEAMGLTGDEVVKLEAAALEKLRQQSK